MLLISLFSSCTDIMKGLLTEARQKLVDEEVEIIQRVVDSPTYQAFRTTQLEYHTKRLRDMVGPLLNNTASREDAGKDLGAITLRCWDLSVTMHTSHLTFQVYFPETIAKFQASTMSAKDQPLLDPMRLQIQQTRLKLVITPVVTMRDDRGTTVIPKDVHSASVLLMPS